jgi:hypothetical protein
LVLLAFGTAGFGAAGFRSCRFSVLLDFGAAGDAVPNSHPGRYITVLYITVLYITVLLDNEAQAGKRLGFNEHNAGRAAPDLLDVVVKPGKLPDRPQRVVHYSTVVTGVSTILTNQF